MKNPSKLTNREIVDFLSQTTANTTFVKKLKIKYRPYVCPFNELLFYAKDVNSVFDIGCGSGQFCALVSKYTKVKQISGIEIDKELIKNANQIFENMNTKVNYSFTVFDGKNLPAIIKKHELIYMIDVYHHIPKSGRDLFMEDLYKNMKKGSKIMLKDIDRSSPFVFFNKIHDLIFAREFGNEISINEAEKKLTNLGFRVIEKRKRRILVYPHYFILAEKN